jgi:hypothetical protein
MWPLPDRDEVNDLMTWQHDLIVLLRKGWRKLGFVLAALLLVALLVNPGRDVAVQVAIALAALLGFDLIFAFAAWLTLSFVDKDKRP